jgi:hypothetical protein
MSEHANPPSRDEVIEKLRQLIGGKLTPRAASAWASPWLSRFNEISDRKVKQCLESLGMADLPSTDREYLYGTADFEAWLRDLAGESR